MTGREINNPVSVKSCWEDGGKAVVAGVSTVGRKSDMRCGERGKGKITKNLEIMVTSLYFTSILVTSP